MFEYWTHALAYVPTRDLRFFLPAMKTARSEPARWFGAVTPADMRKVLRRIRKEGPITIRDIDDDVLVEKHHAWASKKPSKRALQHGFFAGIFVVQQRQGMVKSYELMERHFGWAKHPRAALAREVDAHVLDRALRAQGIVSIDSVRHLDAPRKLAVRALVEARVNKRELVPVTIAGRDGVPHWIRPEPAGAGVPRSHPVAVRPAHDPAKANPPFLRLRAPFRGLRPPGEAALRILRVELPRHDRRDALLGTPIHKGYVYVAMLLALGVEMLNMVARKRRKAAKLRRAAGR